MLKWVKKMLYLIIICLNIKKAYLSRNRIRIQFFKTGSGFNFSRPDPVKMGPDPVTMGPDPVTMGPDP